MTVGEEGLMSIILARQASSFLIGTDNFIVLSSR